MKAIFIFILALSGPALAGEAFGPRCEQAFVNIRAEIRANAAIFGARYVDALHNGESPIVVTGETFAQTPDRVAFLNAIRATGREGYIEMTDFHDDVLTKDGHTLNLLTRLVQTHQFAHHWSGLISLTKSQAPLNLQLVRELPAFRKGTTRLLYREI